MIRSIIMFFLMVYAQGAWAQSYPCPNGPGPGERQVGTSGGANGIAVIPVCERVGGGGVPESVWQSQWIAIATGEGAFGVGKDQPSKRKAQRAALADCSARGGIKCKVYLSTYDQCLAFAGGEATAVGATDQTQGKAEVRVLCMCRSNPSNRDCQVYFSGCSSPIRLR